MSNSKRITLSMKPTPKSTEDKIDAWIQGDDANAKKVGTGFKRTTIYLPEEIHKKLKVTAAKREISMTELIIECLKKEL